MKKFLEFIKAVGYGVRRGIKWYIHMIRYESKWFILGFILDILVIPIKLLIIVPIAIIKPELFVTSDLGQTIMEEITREDL